MSNPTAMIFDISRFAIHDGPGIRTAVFFKGCSNCCSWCHNPESIQLKPQLMYYAARCTYCGNCQAVCPHGVHHLSESIDGPRHHLKREICQACGLCVEACPTEALALSGKIMTVEEVMEPVLADRAYYRQSGGGLTLTGGEPLLQSDFCRALLAACRDEGIHTALETAGYYPSAWLKPLLPLLDLVLFDIKAWNPDLYTGHIGAERDVILENLQMIDRFSIPTQVRTPVIHPLNDQKQEIEAISCWLTRLDHLQHYQLIPYHRLGQAKAEALGLDWKEEITTPEPETIARLEQLASAYVPVYNQKQGLICPAEKVR